VYSKSKSATNSRHKRGSRFRFVHGSVSARRKFCVVWLNDFKFSNLRAALAGAFQKNNGRGG
jgi:hypothetical protein